MQSTLGSLSLALAVLAAESVPVGLTPGRTQALVGLAVGLVSAVVGGVALAGSRRRWAVVALVLGPLGALLATSHLAQASGAIGTGSGKLGAIVGLALALTGTTLGSLALARSRRTR